MANNNNDSDVLETHMELDIVDLTIKISEYYLLQAERLGLNMQEMAPSVTMLLEPAIISTFAMIKFDLKRGKGLPKDKKKEVYEYIRKFNLAVQKLKKADALNALDELKKMLKEEL